MSIKKTIFMILFYRIIFILYQNNLEFLIKKEKVVDYFNRKNIIYYFKKGSY
jgi:hypothetical protein